MFLGALWKDFLWECSGERCKCEFLGLFGVFFFEGILDFLGWFWIFWGDFRFFGVVLGFFSGFLRCFRGVSGGSEGFWKDFPGNLGSVSALNAGGGAEVPKMRKFWGDLGILGVILGFLGFRGCLWGA